MENLNVNLEDHHASSIHPDFTATPDPSNEEIDLGTNAAGLTRMEWLTITVNNLLQSRIEQMNEIAILNQARVNHLNEIDELKQAIDKVKVTCYDKHHTTGTPRSAKLRDPPPFAGNKKELEVLVMSCDMKINNQPGGFPTHASKIQYMASFLDGTPKQWFLAKYQALLKSQEDETGKTLPPAELQTYPGFIKALRKMYGDPDFEDSAANAMDTLVQTASVSEYISEFEALRQIV